jgi:hypothetical protein
LTFYPQRVSCASFFLELAGIPRNHPHQLILALLNQLQLRTNTFINPPTLVIALHHQLLTLIQDSQYPLTIAGDLQAACDLFEIEIHAYCGNDHMTFVPSCEPCFSAHIHFDQGNYDSVTRFIPKFNNENSTVDLLSINSTTHPNDTLLNLCSWNVRGAGDDIKRIMIDAELMRKKISIASIQESHLRAKFLSSTSYYWILGPQPLNQTRASRGVGFLIRHELRQFVISVSFPTVNIGILTFKLPLMPQPFHLVNIHKCSEGDARGAIETGIYNYLTLLFV